MPFGLVLANNIAKALAYQYIILFIIARASNLLTEPFTRACNNNDFSSLAVRRSKGIDSRVNIAIYRLYELTQGNIVVGQEIILYSVCYLLKSKVSQEVKFKISIVHMFSFIVIVYSDLGFLKTLHLRFYYVFDQKFTRFSRILRLLIVRTSIQGQIQEAKFRILKSKSSLILINLIKVQRISILACIAREPYKIHYLTRDG